MAKGKKLHGRIYIHHGDDSAFSKRAVIERILNENHLRGEELLSFGDGVVETEEVRRVGGTAERAANKTLDNLKALLER